MGYSSTGNGVSSGLFVREAGQGAPVVLLHGLASSCRYWQDLRPLAEEYRVLAPDLLGFGRSPKPRDSRYDPDDHVGALREALWPRMGAPAHVVGHSLGSVIALHFAAMHPDVVRSVTLISLPVVGNHAWGHRRDGRLFPVHNFCVHTRPGDAIFSAGMRAIAPVWNWIGPSVRRGVPPEANRDALAATWRSYWRSLEAVVYGTDVRSLIGQVRAPIQLIHGPNDQVAPIEPVRALAVDAGISLVEIPAAGHNPYYTQREPVVQAIRRFLGEVSELASKEPEATQPATGY